jgi:hemerythrin-like domain-containing protein
MRGLLKTLRSQNLLKLPNRFILKNIMRNNKFSSSEKDNLTKKSEQTSQSSGISSGQSSQSGGMGQQSYIKDPQGTMDYMKTQGKEGFGQPIENLVIADHILIRSVYEKLNSASSNEEADKWRNELVYEIARHSLAEEIIMYPVMRDKFPDGERWFKESNDEHHQVKQNLYDAQSIDMNSPDFKKKVKDVMDLLIKHISKEEKEVLPMLKKYLSEEERISLGNSFSRRKLIVPTRPHTMVPEDPPTLNSLLGLLTAPIDKFRDLFQAYPEQSKMAEMKKDASSKSQSSQTSDIKGGSS